MKIKKIATSEVEFKLELFEDETVLMTIWGRGEVMRPIMTIDDCAKLGSALYSLAQTARSNARKVQSNPVRFGDLESGKKFRFYHAQKRGVMRKTAVGLYVESSGVSRRTSANALVVGVE